MERNFLFADCNSNSWSLKWINFHRIANFITRYGIHHSDNCVVVYSFSEKIFIYTSCKYIFINTIPQIPIVQSQARKGGRYFSIQLMDADKGFWRTERFERILYFGRDALSFARRKNINFYKCSQSKHESDYLTDVNL